MPQNSDGQLDMRFDQSPDSPLATAADLINNASQYELAQIFKNFGDERFASVLADKIILAR